MIDTEAVEEFQEVLRDCAPQQHGEGYRISNQQAGFLEATLQQQNWRVKAPEGWRRQTPRQTRSSHSGLPVLGRFGFGASPVPEAGRRLVADFCKRIVLAAYWLTKWVSEKRSRPKPSFDTHARTNPDFLRS